MKNMRRIAYAIVCSIAVLSGSSVSALTESQTNVLNSGIFFFNTEDNSSSEIDSCVGSGTLPSYIPEPYNGTFTTAANAHNVAPELIAALFTEENFTAVEPAKLLDTWSSFIAKHPDPNSGWRTSNTPNDGTQVWADGKIGAGGPFQFEPTTWRGFGYKDADRDNLAVSADAAAKYAQSGGATLDQPVSSWSKFIFSYNHAQWYVNDVMLYYRTYIKAGSGNAGNADTSSCGNVGISIDGFVFPQITTKSQLSKYSWNPSCTDPISEMGPNPPTNDPSKYQRRSGLCHHDYLAADIFNARGVPVVAVRPGRIVSAHDGGTDDNGCPFGMTVRLYSDKALGGDGLWYYYAHMLKPSEGGGLKVLTGNTVKAGDQLGQVGTDRDAECTQSHTHFDVSPVDNSFHRNFDGTGGPLLDPMPALKAAYDNLSEK